MYTDICDISSQSSSRAASTVISTANTSSLGKAIVKLIVKLYVIVKNYYSNSKYIEYNMWLS